MKKRLLLLFIAVLSMSGLASAQKVGLKTNLVHDGFLSPDLGIEIGLAPKWTLDVSGQVNFWTVNKHKWKHWLVQPEARYWFCERFAGHFLAVHALGGEFNFGNISNNFKFLNSDFSPLSDYRYQGWGAGAGVGYGYAWVMNEHWNFEAEIGIGWIYTQFDKYPCDNCGTKMESGLTHNYFGLTKAALSFVYLF